MLINAAFFITTMKQSNIVKCLIGLMLGFSSTLGVAAPLDGVSNMVKVWATVAPEEPLDGATVSVRDAKGRLVGRGRTNENGRENILLTTVDPSAFPLKIMTTGGSAKNVKFHGRLTALTSQVGAEFASVKMDLLSSAASLLANATRTYPRALSEVRQSLGIGKGAPDYVLQVKNIHVDKVRLSEESKRRGGFGAVVNAVAKASRNGRRFRSLEPISASKITQGIAQSDAKPSSSYQTVAAVDEGFKVETRASSASDVCSAPVGNGDEEKSSKEMIYDVGVTAMFALGKYAGVPSAALEPVLGTFLNFPDPTADTLKEIQAQLTCISTQIVYLSEQFAYLSLQFSLEVAVECKTIVDPAWQSYRDAVAAASTYPLDSDNKTFTDLWLPAWGKVHQDCGSAINEALFSTAPGASPAWRALAKMYQDKHGGWLNQSEVQELQEFLAYWGEMEHQQFLLRREFDTYMGYPQDIDSISGFNTADTSKCASGTTSTDIKFCVWANNIKSAYPGDLYSDELGVMSNGRGIMLYPWSTTPNLTYEMRQAGITSRYGYGQIYSRAALEQQDSLILNTSENNTAVETFSNPRVKRKYMTASDQASAFLNYQDDVIQIYLNRTNEDPNSPWKGKDAKDIAASIYESYSNYDQLGGSANRLEPGLFLNNLDSQMIYCYPDYCSNSSTKKSSLIKIGVLLGRSWWPGSSKAATYTPPPPPT